MIVRVLAAAGAVAALALPSTAAADVQDIGIQNSAFGLNKVSVLSGDTVTWNNQSLRQHTVTARDASFASGPINVSGSYSHSFPAAGTYSYYCQIHPFMTGEVDVYGLLLEGPSDPVGRGSQVTLDGRAPAGTSSVEIQADSGSGYAGVATAAADGSGAFHVSLPATATMTYRAVGASGTSPEVKVLVIDRKLVLHASRARRGRGDLLRVRTVPPEPHAIVVLQLDLRERFGWWPQSRRRLDSRGSTVFRAPRGARARVALTLPDGWTPVITSVPLRLPRR
ncbi:MAG TPA: plastocyanin/azurin family copper-binding protein [Thermoleophilaceae bacterium]